MKKSITVTTKYCLWDATEAQNPCTMCSFFNNTSDCYSIKEVSGKRLVDICKHKSYFMVDYSVKD